MSLIGRTVICIVMVVFASNCVANMDVDEKYLHEVKQRAVLYAAYIPLVNKAYSDFIVKGRAEKLDVEHYVVYVEDKGNEVIVSLQIPYKNELPGGGAAEYIYEKGTNKLVKSTFHE